MSNSVGDGGNGRSSTDHVVVACGFICGAAACVAVSNFRQRFKREMAVLNTLVQQQVGQTGAYTIFVVLVLWVNLHRSLE